MEQRAKNQPNILPVFMSVNRAIWFRPPPMDDASARAQEVTSKVAAGTHRFSMNPGQAIFSNPIGALINLAQDRETRMRRNAEAIALWENRSVEVTEDGFAIRDRVRTNG